MRMLLRGLLIALGLLMNSCGEEAPTCTPACEGRLCGPDGCGGFCGLCGTGRCVDGRCESDGGGTGCAGRVCGSDGLGGSCGSCSEGVCLDSGQCGGCTPGAAVCDARDVRECAESGLTTDFVRRCDEAPFDQRCVICPSGQAACAGVAPVCTGSLTGVAGELSIDSDATCGDSGCDVVIVNGNQLALTVAAARMTLSVDLRRTPSGATLPLNAQPGGAFAPAIVSVESEEGRCSNDFATNVRNLPAPSPGQLSLTYGGTGVGDNVNLTAQGTLSCDGGATWRPFGLNLSLLITDDGD